ncbi:Hypothetical protein NTJ_08258 [Nesidiocoris tenuis]|uniref:Uncharacterized protein n=1 Tax=Nesidiocoris tenuis TaxID=355587 RepID=A0ABN7AV92_9HEMI|nr:Hypothetical protein NTJ_08258 [Nesidiocoris tenuis]
MTKLLPEGKGKCLEFTRHSIICPVNLRDGRHEIIAIDPYFMAMIILRRIAPVRPFYSSSSWKVRDDSCELRDPPVTDWSISR